jgi:hypothetical protein
MAVSPEVIKACLLMRIFKYMKMYRVHRTKNLLLFMASMQDRQPHHGAGGAAPPHVGEPNRASKSPPRPQHRRRASPTDRCRPWSINVTKTGRSRRASTRPWPPWARRRPSSKVGELGGRDPRCHCRHGAPCACFAPCRVYHLRRAVAARRGESRRRECRLPLGLLVGSQGPRRHDKAVITLLPCPRPR